MRSNGRPSRLRQGGVEGLEVLKRKGGLLSDPGQMGELLERSRGTRWIAVLDDASAAVFQELVRSAASGLLSRGSHACSEDGSVPLRHVWMVASPVWSAGALLAASLIEGGTSFSITETFLHEPSAPRAAEIPIPAPFGGRDEVGRHWGGIRRPRRGGFGPRARRGPSFPADRAFVHRTSHRERRLATQRFASFVVDLDERDARRTTVASQYVALPKGVSEETFAAAIAEFRRVVGQESVLVTAQQLAPYIKTMMPVADAEHTPSAALLATTVEQIQKIVAICNRFKVPIWTISTGKNLGYGSAAPAERGQVILDLKRMNRILEVDPDLCFALVEPGVTYQQLHDYIQEHKYPLWLSVPAPSAIAGRSGTHSIAVSATRRTGNTSCSRAEWRWSSRTARSCARAWDRCRSPTPGRSSNGATDRTWTGSSPSPTTASSPSSASGSSRLRPCTSRS